MGARGGGKKTVSMVLHNFSSIAFATTEGTGEAFLITFLFLIWLYCLSRRDCEG